MAVLDLLEGIGVVIPAIPSRLVFCEEWMVCGIGWTHDVTGISPQSITLPQKLKGLVSCGLPVRQSSFMCPIRGSYTL